MQIGMIDGATRVLGKSQGYIGLPVRDETIELASEGSIELANQMVTAWFPTPDEIERITAGAPIYLHIIGNSHPPVKMSVGTVPEGGAA